MSPRSIHLALTVLLGLPVTAAISAVTDAHNPRLAAQCVVIAMFVVGLMVANSRRAAVTSHL